MFSHILQCVIAAILISAGIIIMIIQTFAIFRVKYVLNRMHAAAMGDTLGFALVILGLMVLSGFSFALLKLLIIWIVFWIASPVCSHLLAKLEVETNDDLDSVCEVDNHDDT